MQEQKIKLRIIKTPLPRSIHGASAKDDDDIFLLLAIKYSARPYMIAMNPEKWGFEL